MISKLKQQCRKTIDSTTLWGWYRQIKDRRELACWETSGKPCPPPHALKQRVLKKYAIAFGAETLVETGTYLGDMVYAVQKQFKNIVTIELSPELHRRAIHRFRSCSHVKVMQGDSGELMSDLLRTLSGPCLFWLDGHYSSGITAKGSIPTPIKQELRAILNHGIRDHVILIDDARCFDGTNGYPGIESLADLIADSRPDHEFTVSEDIIRIHPHNSRLD